MSRLRTVEELACCLEDYFENEYWKHIVDPRLTDHILKKMCYILEIDVDRLRVVRELRGHEKAVKSLCLWGEFLVSGSHDPSGKVGDNSYDPSLKIWEPGATACSRTLLGHTNWVRCVVPWGDLLVSGSLRVIKVWRVDSETCEMTLTGHRGWVRALAVCGERLCSGSGDHTIRVWSRVGDCERTLEGHHEEVIALLVWDGLLYSGSFDRSIRAWDVGTGRCELKIERAHDSWITAMCIWRGQLVSGSQGGDLKLWDRSGRALRSLVGNTYRYSDFINTLQVWEEFLVSASYDGAIRLWSAEGGSCVRALKPPCRQWALEIWNDQLVIGGDDGVLRVWADDA